MTKVKASRKRKLAKGEKPTTFAGTHLCWWCEGTLDDHEEDCPKLKGLTT